MLYVFIFYCAQERWSGNCFANIIKMIFVFFMLPYHLCIKGIKAFIKDRRQEHVLYLFPYYLISLLIVLISFIFIAQIVAHLKISVVYNELIGFAIVCILIFEFFACGKIIAYFLTKLLIKSVQRTEVKRTSKKNWRNTLNNSDHKKERLDKFNKEWQTVKEELEYTKIYFYIVLTVFMLWIPKEEGTLTSLLVNQFLGITTIAALAREARAKKDYS